ncbi:hypothetical protein [Maridesulfovibrio sp.]|uniref:hypothetical protein n=1 Tax=Maridesulfovibrio sp. TaxID=2795000 RepID=UPI0029F5BD31|nr:hypothetical protein [Maridesulfovibrio sp.]
MQEKRPKQIHQAARASHKESGSVYEYRKIYTDIIDAVDFYCCPENVRRVLVAEGMKSHTVRKHRYPKSHRNECFAPNLLSRESTASSPNLKWVSDITYIPAGEGWLYLTIMQDIFVYLEIFYNRKRRHAGIGYVPPDRKGRPAWSSAAQISN